MRGLTREQAVGAISRADENGWLPKVNLLSMVVQGSTIAQMY